MLYGFGFVTMVADEASLCHDARQLFVEKLGLQRRLSTHRARVALSRPRRETPVTEGRVTAGAVYGIVNDRLANATNEHVFADQL